MNEITDSLGNYIKYTLDNMGNHTAENSYDPSGTLHRTHTRQFNALNELYEDINSAGTAAVTTTYGYDNDGNQTSIVAPLARNTADQYDALNRLTQITDPNSGTTKPGYDGNDNLTSVLDPRSLTTTYSPNGFGDITQIVSPDRFPGQYYQAETGLFYTYFRDHDPQTGRYVEADPIGLDGGSYSTYACAGGNPVSATDPDGSQIVLPVTPVVPPPTVPGVAQGIPPLGQVVINILQNAANASADIVGSAADAVGEAAARQSEYLQAKNFCDTPPPPGSNDCATLSRQIDHAKQRISLYQSWDSRWSPGRHATKLQDWTNRLNQLKAEHRSKCTNKCP